MPESDIDQLRNAVESQHGGTATLTGSVPVKETYEGQTVWEGVVHIFNLDDHPSATIAYAWSSPIQGSNKRRFFAVLHLGACAVEVLMLGDWRAAAGGVGFWPECGHLARPTLGWKSQTGRPERKRFAFHIIRGRWALRAPEQVRWQAASTCLSTWPPSPSA